MTHSPPRLRMAGSVLLADSIPPRADVSIALPCGVAVLGGDNRFHRLSRGVVPDRRLGSEDGADGMKNCCSPAGDRGESHVCAAGSQAGARDLGDTGRCARLHGGACDGRNRRI